MDDANELQVPTYLLRQMTSAEGEASEAFDLLVTCARSYTSGLLAALLLCHFYPKVR